MRDHNYFAYITTNPNRRVLYVGVTNDLEKRVIEHYQNRGDKSSFAGKYYCYCLVYFERFENVNEAIAREKEIKGWVRRKKVALIESVNPKWKFLNEEILGYWPPR